MKKTMTAIIAAVFLVLLAPILADQVAAYAAGTHNDTLETVFNLMVWGIPLGIAAALIIGVFSEKHNA